MLPEHFESQSDSGDSHLLAYLPADDLNISMDCSFQRGGLARRSRSLGSVFCSYILSHHHQEVIVFCSPTAMDWNLFYHTVPITIDRKLCHSNLDAFPDFKLLVCLASVFPFGLCRSSAVWACTDKPSFFL